MRLVLFFSIAFFSFATYSQEKSWWEKEESSKGEAGEDVSNDSLVQRKRKAGKVVIHKDHRIDKLVEFKGTPIPPNFAPQMDGYRIQLFFDQDKDKVNEARSEFIKINNKESTYIEYKAPNYNLLVGNYRTKLEAEKVRAALKNDFPEGIVIATRIYIPRVD